MAASTGQKAPSNTLAADFRLWASFISAALLAGGMTKTADTGQIDLTTVAAPTVANTSSGYEMWQSNDAGTRFYVKIEYGSGSAAANPSIWITVGWATDGAGTIDPAHASTRKQISASGAQTLTMVCSAGVGTGRLIVMMFALGGTGSGTTYQFWFSVERTRDGAGAENATEIMVLGGTQNVPTLSHVVPSTGAVPPQEALIGMALPDNTNIIYGGLCGLGMMFGQKGGFTNPSANAWPYVTAAITQGGQVTMEVYGANHNYLAVGTAPGIATNFGLLMRYD